MLKFHPITAFMKMHANFQKIFLVRAFCFNFIFQIKYKIRILDLMLLPKNSVPFEGVYYSNRLFEIIRLSCADPESFVRGNPTQL